MKMIYPKPCLDNQINLKLFFQQTLHLGKCKKFTNIKLNKYIVGNYGSYEILNMIYSRRFLIWQVNPIIKYAYAFGPTKFRLNTYFLIASVNPALAYVIKKNALILDMDYRINRWLSGTLSARLQLKNIPDFVIVPDTTKSAMIVKEAQLTCIPIIGLVNSHNKSATKVTYPIFGNDDNIYTLEFFCNLCSILILKEQQKASILTKNFKTVLFKKRLLGKLAKKKLHRISMLHIREARFNKNWYKIWPQWSDLYRKSIFSLRVICGLLPEKNYKKELTGFYRYPQKKLKIRTDLMKFISHEKEKERSFCVNNFLEYRAEKESNNALFVKWIKDLWKTELWKAERALLKYRKETADLKRYFDKIYNFKFSKKVLKPKLEPKIIKQWKK